MSFATYSANNSIHAHQTITKQPLVQVRIESLDTGSFDCKNTSKMIACIGTTKTYLSNRREFIKQNGSSYTWQFPYENQRTDSIVVALLMCRLFEKDLEIGKVQIRLSELQANQMTTKEYTLTSPGFIQIPAKVRLSISLKPY